MAKPTHCPWYSLLIHPPSETGDTLTFCRVHLTFREGRKCDQKHCPKEVKLQFSRNPDSFQQAMPSQRSPKAGIITQQTKTLSYLVAVSISLFPEAASREPTVSLPGWWLPITKVMPPPMASQATLAVSLPAHREVAVLKLPLCQ